MQGSQPDATHLVSVEADPRPQAGVGQAHKLRAESFVLDLSVLLDKDCIIFRQNFRQRKLFVNSCGRNLTIA